MTKLMTSKRNVHLSYVVTLSHHLFFIILCCSQFAVDTWRWLHIVKVALLHILMVLHYTRIPASF